MLRSPVLISPVYSGNDGSRLTCINRLCIMLHRSPPSIENMSSACRLLPEILHPLANRFYRAHRTAMKARSRHQVWAMQGVDIEACLCVQPVDGGYWLTNLLVATPLRGQGRASRLLREVRSEVAGPIWLFCNPDLREFYARAGWTECETLPRALADRLERYRQTKELIALRNLSG